MRTSLWSRLRADHGLLFMWILVWLFTLSSVVVNGAHALDVTAAESSTWMRGMAVVVASFFPFAGLVMTEAVLIMIRSWRIGHWWVTAMQALLVVASLVMLIVAFWRSFNALTEMAVMLSIPASDAWMLPVLTDTGIVVGTIGVVLAEVKMKIDHDAGVGDRRAAEAARVAEEQTAEHTARATAGPAAERASECSTPQLSTGVEPLNPTSEQTEQTEQIEVEQPVECSDEQAVGCAPGAVSAVAIADEHLPAHPVERATEQPEHSEVEPVERLAQASELGLNGIEQDDQEWLSDLLSGLDDGAQCADEGVEQPVAQPEQAAQIKTEQPVAQPVKHSVAQPEQAAQIKTEQPVAQPVKHSVAQPEQAAQIEIEQPVEQPERSAQADARSLAERAHPELSPKVSVAVLAELIEASRAGASQRRLGDMAGVSPNTAARYVQAAERLGDSPEAA